MKKILFLITYWFNLVFIFVLTFGYRRQKMTLRVFGNKGASWKVPTELLSSKSLCYCAGVGEDISFERGLFRVCHPEIHLFDPTPRAIQFIASQKLPPKVQFHPWGLWSKNKRQKFFEPTDQSFVSHSIVNLQQTKKYFVGDCKNLTWIMKQLGHTQLDLLKIDIEGAEYNVLDHLLRTKTRPRILAVEFDQPVPVFRTFSMITRLIGSGYDLVDQTGWNFIFIYNEVKEK